MKKKKCKNTVVDYPVKGFPIKFEWQTNEWLQLFDAQVDLLKEDISRARADDRAVVYLSCPISNRGGGYSGANVDIAKHTQYHYTKLLGERFWILNPAQYQMESKEGTGLIHRHAKNIGISEKTIKSLPDLTGGDYMRMWTRVLVEDQDRDGNFGLNFDAYIFLGPTDTDRFFTQGGAKSKTAGIEEYFARKFSTDPEFRNHFSPAPKEWEKIRKEFIRFYALRAGATFSKGCHDEWNILVALNQLRLKKKGIGEQLACFFDGDQVSPGSSESLIAAGYALSK